MASESYVIVSILNDAAHSAAQRFTTSFTIGRSKECDLVIKHEAISRKHCRVEFDGRRWLLQDLESGNGTFLNGARIMEAELAGNTLIELGHGGPQISLRIEVPEVVVAPQLPDEPVTETVPLSGKPATRPEFATETQVIRHYIDKPDDAPAGEQTMIIRRAFERVHQTRSKKYKYLIGVTVLLLVVAGSVIIYQKQKLEKMRATAQNIFYLMKTQELQIGKLEEVVLLKADPQQLAELQAKREKFKGMEQEYDSFIKELGIYGKLSEEDKVILKVARTFGECELNMPQGFVDEVKRYIGIWKSSDRLKTSLDQAKDKGFTPVIMKTIADYNLPPQYFFLGLQESNFNERAVGPPTRYGHAKGMWQFISPTANQYGLRIGPLYDQPVYDPLDERFNFDKSTIAAMKYIRELNNTGAQASGLLVLASYNWGEGNVREVINKMPENPRERNFWRLLAMKNIPRETYDYVFLIFAAAVICEKPQLFGFDGACPSFGPPAGVTPIVPGLPVSPSRSM